MQIKQKVTKKDNFKKLPQSHLLSSARRFVMTNSMLYNYNVL